MAGLEPWALGYALAAVFVGAFVRGYTGFGSSLIWVASLTLVLPPAAVVPVILMLEVAASLHLLPRVWRDVQWRTLRPLLLGAWAATPFGLYLLARLPMAPMQAAISVVVLAAAILLWRGYALRRTPGPVATFATGVLSGALNGSTSVGGPPVILFFFASPAGAAVGRASIIAYFLGTDAVGAAMAAVGGLLGWDALIRFAWFLPAMLLGASLGNRRFLKADPATFRRAALVVLMVLALAGLVRAVQ